MEKKEQFQKQKLQLKLTDQLRQSLDAAALQNVAQNTTAQSSTEQQSEQVVSNANETRLYQPTLRDSLVVYRSKKNTLRRIVVSKEKKSACDMQPVCLLALSLTMLDRSYCSCKR